MRTNIPIQLVFEDAISEHTMIAMLNCFGNKYSRADSYAGYGSGYIRKNISGFNQASISTPFFVLTDLDNYECPIALKNDWLRRPPSANLIFRIAIKEVEAWLLSDIEGFSEFSGVSRVNFPAAPELEIDPKRTLINLIRRSRKRNLKDDIIPINDNAQIGPNYNECLMQFVNQYWSIERAMSRSESLRRAYQHLDEFNWTHPVS